MQISTTLRESSTEARCAPASRWMDFLMKATARLAPVVTAWMEAPENQKTTAPPVIRPRRKGACMRDRFSMPRLRWSVRPMMMEKIMVVAPTTAVPMRTGLAVALKVLPAPSLSSRRYLARSHRGAKPKSRRIWVSMSWTSSMRESS